MGGDTTILSSDSSDVFEGETAGGDVGPSSAITEMQAPVTARRSKFIMLLIMMVPKAHCNVMYGIGDLATAAGY